MTDMDQGAVTRMTKLAREAQDDPKKAAKLRKQLKKYLDRQKRQRPQP
jgi:hypothetical protein